MKEAIKEFLNHAAMALDDAEFLHKDGRILALVNRSYYAIFYCISALLLTEGITTKKHTGAQSKFNEHFIKTGLFDIANSKLVARSFDARQSADYDMESAISDEHVQQLLSDARHFYDLTLAYFREHPVG